MFIPVGIELRVAPLGNKEGLKFTYVGDLPAPGSRGKGRSEAVAPEAILAALPQAGEWVSAPKLARTIGLSESTVKRALKRLLEEERIVDNGKEVRWKLYGRVKSADADDPGGGAIVQ